MKLDLSNKYEYRIITSEEFRTMFNKTDKLDTSDIIEENQEDSNSLNSDEELQLNIDTDFSDSSGIFDYMTLQEPTEKDETKKEKTISLAKKLKNSEEKEELVISVKISPEGVAKIICPNEYDSDDIDCMIGIINSNKREKLGNNSNYDEDFSKDKRDDPEVIFSMILNAATYENHMLKILYFPEPTETLEGENPISDDIGICNDARKKYQERISKHIFESIEKMKQTLNENKPKFVFVPYKIGIWGAKGLQSHELLLVFDMSKQKGDEGYVKYFDSSHFTQTIPEEKIKVIFPEPPFSEGFGIKKNDLINKKEENVFQKGENNMSCTYWVEAFLLTLLKIKEKDSIKEVINGTFREDFEKQLKDKFKDLRKTQFRNQYKINSLPLLNNYVITNQKTPKYPIKEAIEKAGEKISNDKRLKRTQSHPTKLC